MQSAKIISLSVWLMISFNLLLAFCAVWSLQRMSPEIVQIYNRNVVSLEACENMFLALTGENVDVKTFQKALNAAEQNITERGEAESLARIRTLFSTLDKENQQIKKELAREIRNLSFYNRRAIVESAERTQKMRQAGAWGLVFLTFFFFIAALLFEQRLRRSLLRPLQEISSVLDSNLKGDKLRRCSCPDASLDMKKLFRAVNSLLDSSHFK